MPALSKLIGRKQQNNYHQNHNSPNPNHFHALPPLHLHQQNQEESSSISNSIIFTSTTTNTTSLDDEDEDDGLSPISSSNSPNNTKLMVPLLMSTSSKPIMDHQNDHHNENEPGCIVRVRTEKHHLQQFPLHHLHHDLLLNSNNNTTHYKNLTHLDISGNSAEKLDLRSLTRLEWLCCSNNNLEILVLSGLSINYLDCSHNNLQCISIDPLPNNLSTLQVSFNNLEELPVWTWIVPELYTIYASNNHLRQIDCKYQNCLLQLPLRELYVYSNKIEFISKDFIQRATRLKILNLSQNLIEYMPNFGKRCPIQELYMSRNQLQDNEDRNALDFLLDCTSIRRLYLAFNKIQHINERYLISWKNLEELILCGNRIRNLPSKLSSLPSLRVLRVHFNQLETVPNLTKLSTLKVVDLSHNNLRKINLENLIAGGNLTYLDISCNEKLSLNLENFPSSNRPMNLVEVTHPRKTLMNSNSNNDHFLNHLEHHQNQNNKTSYENNSFQFAHHQPPWDLGFSELPDKNQTLSVAQYRDVNLSNGKETLFGLFDSGDGNPAPKSLSKSIAKIYIEEKSIDESPKFSLKYTLLNALNCMFDADRNSRQQGNVKPMQGVLCLLSTYDNINNYAEQLGQTPGGNHRGLMLNLAMIGNVRCILVESGKKVKVLTELNTEETADQGQNDSQAKKNSQEHLNANEDDDLNNSKPAVNNTGKPPVNLNTNKIIQDPITVTVPLTRATEFLVVANQNVWNYINDQELVDELDLHRHKKSVLISKRITDMAQSHSCKESLSIIVVRFKWNTTNSSSSNSSNVSGSKSNLILDVTNSTRSGKVTLLGESNNGPMSYISHHSGAGGSGCGSSDGYSDELTNPLASVTTPDSAIDTDNRSSRSSGTDSNKSSPDKRRIQANPPIEDPNINTKDADDIVSLSNTSVSQMSVEQFRCWEYMLEQNTRLLFKKELDSLSKATAAFQRNQKLRKSVHFPFKQQQDQNNTIILQQPADSVKNSKSKDSPGFFTLSKAKSLSHLFSSENPNHVIVGSNNNPKRKSSTTSHGNLSVSFRPRDGHYQQQHLIPQIFTVSNSPAGGFNKNGPFLDGQIRPTKGTIIGGPNAAYFGSVQRIPASQFFQIPASMQSQQKFYDKDEIQELRHFDSIEHDNRLKKYWDNKITEL